MQALIKFKNYFYFEERDEQVDDVEKVRTYVWYHHDVMMTSFVYQTLQPLSGSRVRNVRYFANPTNITVSVTAD